MTVAQFQRINEIIETTPDTVEQLGWMICEAFNKTYEQVDAMNARKVARYATKLEKALTAKEPLFPSIRFQTDATKITFGQFIEVQHWLKQDLPAVLDLVAASIMLNRIDHKEDAAMIRERPLRNVLLPVKAFVESLEQLIKSYKGLFEPDTAEGDDDEIRPMKKGPNVHPFVEQYGWIYSATEVAQHEGIKLEEAFDLPVIQALNDLSYLKAKQQYDKHMSKR